MKIFISFFAFVALLGCQGVQPRSPIEAGWKPITKGADHGTYSENYQEIIKKWYMSNLKDPNSAVFVNFSKPRKEHAITNQFKKEVVYGYSACATVNAKNSYGGFAGTKTKWFLFKNGKIVKYQDPKYPIYIGHKANCEDGIDNH